MKNIINGLLVALILIVTVSSCRKDDDDTPDPLNEGSVNVEFNHVMGMMNPVPFELNTAYTHHATSDELTFSMFRYYVSNIQLVKDDNTIWSEEESYHIVNVAEPGSLVLNLKNIPAGTYKELRYTMGVDAARNTSGAQNGALAPSNGMFWSWNTGYIFLKAEGTSPQATSNNNNFMFHLGGFEGANNIITPKTTDFGGATLTVSAANTPSVHLTANPGMLWHSAQSVSQTPKTHMPGALAVSMASDFYGSVSFSKID